MRVLCDCLTPYKQYMTEIIENVVDGISTPEDLTTENYPCEKTMERWKRLIVGNRVQIDGALKSVGSRYLGFGVELLESKVSLLDTLRIEGAGWLAIVNRIMWNFRLTFLNARQLKDVPPGLLHTPAKLSHSIRMWRATDSGGWEPLNPGIRATLAKP